MSDPLPDFRYQFILNNIATLLFSYGWYVFSSGLIRGIRYAIEDPRKPVPYMCAIQCALGLLSTGFYVSATAPFIKVPCHAVMLLFHFFYALSYLSILSILLMKSYVMHRRHQGILWTGCFLIFVNACTLVYAGWEMQVQGNGFTCVLDYGDVYNLLRLVVDLATHTFLSCSILAAVWLQLRLTDKQPDIWMFYRILLQDGLIYGLSVCLLTCLCALIDFYDLFSDRTHIVYAVNWMVISALITHQLRSARVRASQTVYFTQHSKSTFSLPRHRRKSTMDTCATPRTYSIYTLRSPSVRSSLATTAFTNATTFYSELRQSTPETSPTVERSEFRVVPL